MIISLRIQNVALIDQVEVDFAPGLNVLTGETGAGKSILVDSINFMLGARPVRDFVRMGADFAHVEGVLEVSDPIVKEGLFELGINVQDSQIMLERVMQANGGKSTCRINGRPVSVGLLKEAASFLVDVHGQHEHQSLLNPAKQIRLLDQFCGEELASLKRELEALLARYRETDKALKSITGTGNQRQEQIEIWRFQLDEIEKAALKPNEEDELTIKRNRLSVSDKLSKNASQAISLLYGSYNSNSATDQVSRASTLLTDMAKLDPTCESLKENINEAAQILTELVAELRNYSDELDANPHELERIETRLDIIYKTKKKYGGDIETVLKKQEELTTLLDNLENSEVEIKRLQIERRKIIKEITAVCDKMNARRTIIAEEISGGITAILKDLGMKSASFSILIQRKTAFGPDGNDAVDFMISPNPGEPEKPLRRIASGGEMSRVMLAIKTVMADADRMDTVIFDEVDTGVSGRTAQQVAEKLMGISRRRQILCITHLPQIAAMADTHFMIEKQTDGDRTITKVHPLERTNAAKELARLIGGAEITAATMEAATEMKSQADGLKGI